MITTVPICFYPMKKLIVDDDNSFAQSILLKMHGHNFIAYNSPEKALDYLLNNYQPKLTKSKLIKINNTIENSSTNQNFSVNIHELKSMLHEKQHDDISVLLIDYHMPEMYGVDLLKKITKLPMKKVLITSEKDYSIAIDAFNTGLVDAYIRKDELDFLEKIQTITFDLEWKYFTELSEVFDNVSNKTFNYLGNNNFVEVFKKFIISNKIVAFSLIDMLGTFLTKDYKGHFKYFIVRSKDQLQQLSNIAKEDGASSLTISSLEQENSIPFFNEMDFWQVPGQDWDKYLHHSIAIDNSLFWTAIDCS